MICSYPILVCCFSPPDPDSDSDSDLSLEDDQSGSYASTHSSDSEEDEPFSQEQCWESLAAQSNDKTQHSVLKGNAAIINRCTLT